MNKPTIEMMRTQDIAGVPTDWALYQAKNNPAAPMTDEEMMKFTADETAKQVAEQIELSELYYEVTRGNYPAAQEKLKLIKLYNEGNGIKSKPYPLANLELKRLKNDMTPAATNKISDFVSAFPVSPAFQGMIAGLLIEVVVFGAVFVVGRLVFGWFLGR